MAETLFPLGGGFRTPSWPVGAGGPPDDRVGVSEGTRVIGRSAPDLFFTATVLVVASLARLRESSDLGPAQPVSFAHRMPHGTVGHGFMYHLFLQRHPDGLTQRRVRQD